MIETKHTFIISQRKGANVQHTARAQQETTQVSQTKNHPGIGRCFLYVGSVESTCNADALLLVHYSMYPLSTHAMLPA